MSSDAQWSRDVPLTLIAETGRHFEDFGPYVPSINASGTVAFYASRPGGVTGVYTGDGRTLRSMAERTEGAFVSHPDIDDSGRVSVYAELPTGGCLMVGREGAVHPVAEAVPRVGPAGPVMNNRGVVGFRGWTRRTFQSSPLWVRRRVGAAGGLRGVVPDDRAGVFMYADGEVHPVAMAPEFTELQGLPVVNDAGTMIFRADTPDGGQGIYAFHSGSRRTVVETGVGFDTLGRFPFLDERGSVVFTARRHGREGVFQVDSRGEVQEVIGDGGLTGFRGALIDGQGRVVYYATPHDGTLGVYRAPFNRILGLGDPLHGSLIADLALNPVSINVSGQLAIRISLADGRGLIVRSEVG